MREQMKVLLVAAEAYPFAKVGGLADVAGSLPKPLYDRGVDIRVMIPLYDKIDREKFGIEYCGVDFDIEMGDEVVKGQLLAAKFPDSEIPIYFIECKKYFGRPGIYTDPETGEAYPDDGERFVFFSKAIIEAIHALGWTPDVFHANDYQTGLVPALIKIKYPDAQIGFLYSIHNLAYQGRFEFEILDIIGIGKELVYPMGPFEFFNKVNFMKVGISFADIVNTVSPTYAKEIQTTEEYGYGLEGVLRSVSDRLFGVINGIDSSVWNPESDKNIPYNYNADDLSGKRMCKAALLKEVGLPSDALDIPLIAMISRLADQKGFDILLPVMEDILKDKVMFLLLGTGNKKYEAAFEKLALKYPKKLAAVIDFKGPLAHRIEAGADMFLMPSRYEPCGLNQMYSMAYGTVPVVRKTGGLADTVKPANLEKDTGNGFVFEEYSGRALLGAVRRAVEAFKDGRAWRKLQGRCMSEDFTWGASADKYIELYRQALALRRYGI